MVIKDINRDNIGAVCCVYRQAILNEPANSFADRHDVSKGAVSYFERGMTESLPVFLAYLQDGLFDYLPVLDDGAIQARALYNTYHYKRNIKK